MIPGPVDGEGRLHIQSVVPTGTISGGVQRAASGAVAIVNTAPTTFVNGLPFNSTGRLCIAFGGVVTHRLNGLPYVSNGRLFCQQDTIPGPNDPFVGGLRVGPLGGVYLTTAAPSPVQLPA